MYVLITFIGIILLSISVILGSAAIIGRKVHLEPTRNLNKIDERLQNALWYASLAANSHNAQAWKIQLNSEEQKLRISIDKNRKLGIVDSNNREAYLSLGCYVETLEFSLKAFGYQTEIAYFEQEGDFFILIHYQLISSAIDQSKLNLLNKRHTNKSAYSNQKINQSSVDLLTTKFSTYLNVFQKDEKNFEYLKNSTLRAIIKQSENQAYREELAKWLRFSNRETKEKLDGLPAEMLGLNGIIKTFYYWSTNRESAKKDKFAEQGIGTAKKQLNNCGAFLVITGGISISELIDTGRKTQRIWFECTNMDIAVHPMSALLETEPFNSSIQKDLLLKESVQMILRIGYVNKYGENLGLRRNLEDYIEVESKI